MQREETVMTYRAVVLADSIASGVRLTTMEVTFPRFILAELNTHRTFSRNSASSRAIPVERRIAQVRENPFVPEAFTQNRKGMQADVTLDDAEQSIAEKIWRKAAESACDTAEELALLGVHKQHANRILEPYVWHTVVISATEFANFFALRTDKAAQPEMQIIAKMMLEAYEASVPRELEPGDWHLPYVDVAHEGPGRRPMIYALPGVPMTAEFIPPEMTTHQVAALIAQSFKPYIAASVTRCAAVSYERQSAERPLEELLKRHDELLAAGHMSPFEHQARVATHEEMQDYASWFAIDHPEAGLNFTKGFIGNFRAPFLQYRKTLPGEAVWRSR